MKRLALASCLTLILSGCALTSTYTIDASGKVSGTTTFGIPKSAVRNVTTLDQWAQVMQSNDFPSPTPSPSDSVSGMPTPEVSCGPGEDLVNSAWTYSCAVSGDISVLSDATNLSGITGQVESSDSTGLQMSRVGNTVTIKQRASNTSGGSGLGLGLKGISLIYTNSTITFPGDVTSVSGGAEKIDDHTVSFTADENQASDMGATVVMSSLNSTATALALSAKPSPLAAGSAEVSLTASLATPAVGQVRFFDGDLSLGSVDVNATGTAKFIAEVQPDGAHDYKAVFEPRDWWNVDQSQAQISLSFKTFAVSIFPNIAGVGKVGATLSVGNLKPKPVASQVSYKWLRNGKVISGKSGKTYKVNASDFSKRISARVTLQKSGYLPIALTTRPLKISQR